MAKSQRTEWYSSATFLYNSDIPCFIEAQHPIVHNKVLVVDGQNLNGKVHREDGLVFCGMNSVRDYPFGFKHWCAPDGEFVGCPIQYCGQGLTLNEHGEYVPLENLA